MNDERKPHMSSVIGETAVVIGNISGQGDLEVRGKVQGSIELVGRIFVAESGVVLGNIEAGTVTVSGEVRGDLSASDGILIQASGEVEGNLLAPRVGVEPGARVRGMLRTGSAGKEPLPQEATIQRDTETSSATSAHFPASDKVSHPIEAPSPEKLGKARKRRRPRKPGQSEGNLSVVDSSSEANSTGGARNGAGGARNNTKDAAANTSETVARAQHGDSVEKKPQKPRQKGPPKPPTFVKGAKGHQRG